MSIIQQKDSECSTNGKKKLEESCNKNDESIYPPALLLNDQVVEWDSMLDDTKPNVQPYILIDFID